jgi:hypothetical protein
MDNGKDQSRAIRVQHPGRLTVEDIQSIDKLIIAEIDRLTGCACLSGTIDVIWERSFEKVLDVDLGRPFTR